MLSVWVWVTWKNTEDSKQISQMLNISPMLLENSVSAKNEEGNLNHPKFYLTEVINMNNFILFL